MAKPLARMGDISNHGGLIMTGAIHHTWDGQPLARLGDLHVCPLKGHGVTPIVTGSTHILIEGKPAARLGDIAGCGAVISSGSKEVIG